MISNKSRNKRCYTCTPPITCQENTRAAANLLMTFVSLRLMLWRPSKDSICKSYIDYLVSSLIFLYIFLKGSDMNETFMLYVYFIQILCGKKKEKRKKAIIHLWSSLCSRKMLHTEVECFPHVYRCFLLCVMATCSQATFWLTRSKLFCKRILLKKYYKTFFFFFFLPPSQNPMRRASHYFEYSIIPKQQFQNNILGYRP